MIIYCRIKILKKPGETLDLLFEIQPLPVQKNLQKNAHARSGIKFQDLKKPGPTLYFILKTRPSPISLWAGIFEDLVDGPMPVFDTYMAMCIFFLLENGTSPVG